MIKTDYLQPPTEQLSTVNDAPPPLSDEHCHNKLYSMRFSFVPITQTRVDRDFYSQTNGAIA